jgi:hypothetical protein
MISRSVHDLLRFKRSKLSFAGQLFILSMLMLVGYGCSEQIAGIPPASTTNAADYFWPLNTTGPLSYWTQDSAGATANYAFDISPVQQGLRASEGLTGNVISFAINPQRVYIDQYGFNHLFPMPRGGFFTDSVAYDTLTKNLGVKVLLYLDRTGTLLVGTESEGVYYSTNEGTTWMRSWGMNGVSVQSMAFDSVHGVIYAVSKDSIFFSSDVGRNFVGRSHFGRPSDAICASNKGVIFLGGAPKSSLEYFTSAGQDPADFSPALGATSSVISLAVVDTTIIAGAYASSTTNHIFTSSLLHPKSSWSAPTVDPGSSSHIYCLCVDRNKTIYAGTNGRDLLYYSKSTGRSWSALSGSLSLDSTTRTLSLACDPVSGDVFAGTDKGDVFRIHGTDSAEFYSHISGQLAVNSMVVTKSGKLIAASDSGLFLLGRGVEGPINTLIAKIIVKRYGTLTLLDRGVGGLRQGSSWAAGSLCFSGLYFTYPLTGRVQMHLDSLQLPLPLPTPLRKDVFVVRYAAEDVRGDVRSGVPYWFVYYEKGFGPVVIELLRRDNLTDPPTVLNKVVYNGF